MEYEIVDDTLIVKSRIIGVQEFCHLPDTIKKVIIAEGVEEIQYSAFSGNIYIKEVIISSSVKCINARAFEDSYIKVLKLSEGLEFIGPSAFSGCSIEKVEIPFSVNNIGFYAFELNTFKRVYLYEDSPVSKWNNDRLKYVFGDAEIILRPNFKIPSEEEFNVKAVSDDERLRLGRELFELVSSYNYVENKDNLDKVMELLLNGADTEIVDDKGNTGLMVSIKKNYVNTFKLYMLSKCDINHKNKLGDNPLILSSRYNRNELASILIDNDCIINGINRLDEDALSIAISNNNSYLVDMLERLMDIEKKYNMNNLDDRLRRVLSR